MVLSESGRTNSDACQPLFVTFFKFFQVYLKLNKWYVTGGTPLKMLNLMTLIVMDLQKSNFDNELTKRFTIETIVSSLEVINEDEELGRIVVPIAKDPELKKSHQELLKKHQKKILMEKQQNYMNVRRTESADKFKREKQ